MPLTLNVAFNRKVGEANFGSRGASVSLEVEVESDLVREPDKLRAKIGYLFQLAQASVEAQLNGGNPPQQAPPAANGNGSAGSNGANGNGSQGATANNSNGNGNGNGSRRTNGRQATASQVRAIRAIAGRRRLDLMAELQNRFGVDRPDDLSIGQASELIDSIKPQDNGNGGRR